MKHRHYDFKSIWDVAAAKNTVESEILDLDSWPKWWNGLVDGNITHPQKEIVGSIITARWQSMFKYKLAMQLTITDYKKGQYISFTSKGDLIGKGSWSFVAVNTTRTRMEIIWEVETQKTWMNVAGLLFRPVFVYAHHRLMESGEKGLRKYISTAKD